MFFMRRLDLFSRVGATEPGESPDIFSYTDLQVF